jgi:hypothetical protein
VLDPDIQSQEVDFSWRSHATTTDDPFPRQQQETEEQRQIDIDNST